MNCKARIDISNSQAGMQKIKQPRALSRCTYLSALSLSGAWGKSGGIKMATIYGTKNADTLYGTDNNDKIYGWAKGGNENSPSGNDKLFGKAGNDELYGGTGNDTLEGGAGNDKLYGGTGRDTLDGGMGIDTLVGGKGDDTYIVDSTTDTIKEYEGGGIDTVKSSVSYTLGDWLNNLTLTGNDPINGTGNSLDNTIFGNDANNILKGGSGNDTIDGGERGGDTIYGEAGNDRLTTPSGLEADYESLVYGGDGNDTLIGYGKLYGDKGNDSITGIYSKLYGGEGNDRLEADYSQLYGEDGNDTLIANNGNVTGGKGKDTITVNFGGNSIAFNNPSEGADTIYGFSLEEGWEDTIIVSAKGFGGGLIAGATITPEQFVLGTAPVDANTRFIYNIANGNLFFDVDGTGASATVQLATFVGVPAITNNDIVAIA